MSDTAEALKRPGPPRLWARLLSWALLAGVLVLVGRMLYKQIVAEDWSTVQFSVWPLVGAFGAMALGRGMIALSYHGVLAGFGARVGWPQMMTIAWLPMAGKYIPGKVASVAGAIWLLRRNGVPMAAAVSGVFIVNALLVLVGILLSVPLTLWGPVQQKLPQAWLWCAILLTGGAVCLHPRVFASLGNFVLRRLHRPELTRLPDLKHYVGPILVMLGQCTLNGVALWLMAASVGSVELSLLPLLIAGAALANTMGFLAVFAPGGVGVREGILLLLLKPVLPNSAGIVVVASRIVFVLAETLLILLGAWLLRVCPPPRADVPAENATSSPESESP